MKKTLLIAAVAMLAVPAMASKARLNSLNSSAHLSDIQDVFNNTSKVTRHGDWLTFEMGQTNATATVGTEASPRAEGGFARGMGDATYGFYLGHKNKFAGAAGTGLGARQAGYLSDENPIDLFYAAKAGDLNWGVGLHYSNSDKKSIADKQSTTALNVGVSANNWDVALDLGLVNTYKDSTTAGSEVDFKGTTGIALNGSYTMDTLTYSALYGMNGGKEEVATTTTHDISNSVMSVGVVNSHKAEGSDFFYGANYVMTTEKDTLPGGETKTESTALPVFIGLEANANSWLVLRASVAQNFILGSTKTTTAGVGEADTIGNDTTVAAGAGLKFNKLQVDGTLKGNATGDIDGNTLLANASVTYLF